MNRAALSALCWCLLSSGCQGEPAAPEIEQLRQDIVSLRGNLTNLENRQLDLERFFMQELDRQIVEQVDQFDDNDLRNADALLRSLNDDLSSEISALERRIRTLELK